MKSNKSVSVSIIFLLITSLSSAKTTSSGSQAAARKDGPAAKMPERDAGDVEESTLHADGKDERTTEFANTFVWYKNKFLVFDFGKGEVAVYEDRMIPYKTRLRKVFYPPPKGTVVKVHSPVANKIVVIETSDGKKWTYERFKLRQVHDPSV